MDTLGMDEDEDYQIQCGEMFFTRTGRLIFHCTLCENKFSDFSMYEYHLKDHIVSTFDDDQNECLDNDSVQNAYEDAHEMFEEQPNNATYENDTLIDANLENENNVSKHKSQNFVKTEDKNEDIQVVNEISSEENLVLTTKLEIEKVDMPEITRNVRKVTISKSSISEEERKHKCPICNAAFKEKHNMQHHLKRHTNKKDYKCPECDKSFYFSSELRVHLRSHSNERPYLCNVCGNSFAHNSLLLVHLRRHSGQKTKKCEVCEKTFFNNSDLKKHMASHSDERPYSCEICSADFARSRTLKNHLKLHNNKKEYECKICEHRFNQRAGLTSHMKSVHKTASNF